MCEKNKVYLSFKQKMSGKKQVVTENYKPVDLLEKNERRLRSIQQQSREYQDALDILLAQQHDINMRVTRLRGDMKKVRQQEMYIMKAYGQYLNKEDDVEN